MYVPSLALAFEYQGERHYHFHYLAGNPTKRKLRDHIKKQIATANGLTLIEVPYWWDMKRESLAATVYHHRPDLFHFPVDGLPMMISHNVPQKQNPLGLMHVKSTLLKPTPWINETTDPTGWYLCPFMTSLHLTRWVSEKLDGVRVRWNGSALYMQSGCILQAPDHFTCDLPHVPLDAMLLWYRAGRQQHEGVHDAIMKEQWDKMELYLFDAPFHGGLLEERMKFIRTLQLPRHVKCVEMQQCMGTPELLAQLRSVIQHGGEGLMLRRPRSLYEYGPSRTLLKVTLMQTEKACVVGIAKDSSGIECKR